MSRSEIKMAHNIEFQCKAVFIQFKGTIKVLLERWLNEYAIEQG